MGKPHLEHLKQKIASEVGVNLSKNFNGDITTRQAGLVGGNMVKELIIKAQQDLVEDEMISNQSNDWISANNSSFH